MSATRWMAALLGTVILGIGIAACGSGNGTGEEVVSTPGVEVSAVNKELGLGKPSPKLCEGKQYKIGVDYFSTTEPFAQEWLKGIEEAAEKTGCVEITAISDDLDPAKAVANAQTFVQQHMDAVLLLQVIASAQPGVMRILNEAHIPAVASAIPAPGATFLSVPDYESGFGGGEFLGKAAAKKWPGKKPYLIMGGFPDGGTVEVDRINGVIEGVEKAIPGIPANHVFLIDTKAEPSVAHARALEAVSKVPAGEPILVSAINDITAYSEFQAVRQAGRANDALALGVGAVYPAGVNYVCDTPQYVGAITQKPETWGGYLIPSALGLLNGKQVPPSVNVPWEILTRENAKEIYPQASC